ncbi:MAG: hypothetical protein O7D86_01770 [Proteobacteria bacterium]|nr:hypothetical protein [Pseudomonadota bacterium]
MNLRVRLNLLITLLFISLFVCSSFYIIANARTAVHREVESTAHLALQLIEIAISSDEIDENWTEVRSILILLLVFIILANILVYITIGKYLSPIDTILSGLSDIEKGNYHLELPHFRLPELDRISQQFNHMAKVLLESKARKKNDAISHKSCMMSWVKLLRLLKQLQY